MDYKIVWTEHAIEDYRRVVDYLLIEWSEEVAINFIHTVEEIERAILLMPQSGKIAYKDISVRGRLVTKHNKIYYRIKEQTIEILQMRDTRLSPEKNPFE